MMKTMRAVAVCAATTLSSGAAMAEEMPDDLLGVWRGQVRVQRMEGYWDIAIDVAKTGAQSEVGRFQKCSAYMFPERAMGARVFEATPDPRSQCGGKGTFTFGPVTGDTVQVTLGTGAKAITAELKRIVGPGSNGGNSIPAVFEILGLKPQGFAPFEAAVKNTLVKDGYAFQAGDEYTAAWSSSILKFDKLPGGSNYSGDALLAQFASVEQAETDSGKPVAPLLILARTSAPAEDEKPTTANTIAALLEKYGTPSARGPLPKSAGNAEDTLIEWHFDTAGTQLSDASPCGTAADPSTVATSRTIKISDKAYNGVMAVGVTIDARRDCGWSLIAQVQSLTDGRLDHMRLLMFNQAGIIADDWKRYEAGVSSQIAQAREKLGSAQVEKPKL